MKILFSPCHYIYDEIAGGSEPSWAFNIADRIANIYPKSMIITGFKNVFGEKKYKIIEIQPNKKNIDLSIKNAMIFNIKNFLKTKKILAKNRFDILHHILPFSINNTFNLNFIFSKKNTNLIIGPIQSPQTYKDPDVNLADIRSKIKQNNSNKIFFGFIYFLIYPILKVLSNLTLKKAKAIIVINQYTKKILIQNGINPKKIYIIPPGIDIKKFAYSPFAPKNKEKIELLVVCYLLKRKGVDLIIRAIEKVVKKNKNIILRIVGDGPQKENLENLVKKLNLEDYIIFEGFVENRKIHSYYKKAHIFLNMSRSEGFATVCLEAMASGLAVISSKVGGFSDVVKNNINGYLIEQEDYVGLADKIIYLLVNQNIINKMGKNAREGIEKGYDWDKVIIPEYLNVYSSLGLRQS